jgi:hypothetical protein
MRAQGPAASVLVIAVLGCFLGASGVEAQSVCAGPPYLGSSGPELCVNISEDGGASLDFRGPSPININQTFGDYRVNLAITYAVDGAGMGVTIEGTASRTTAGPGGITIRADGGTNVAVPAASGSLVLIGDATGASRVQLGGAAGFRHISGDVAFESYLITCDEMVFGGGPFECTHDSIPVNPGAVAATNITVIHITNVGDIVDIPSTTGVGPFNSLPTSRRFGKIANLRPGITPLENRVEALAPAPDPALALVSLYTTGPNMNHLCAFRVPPPYDGTGVTFQDDIDVGPLFSVHRICVTATDEAVVAYIKYNGGNYDVFVAGYDGSSWSAAPVAATSIQDFHTVTCFQTTDGLFLKTFNNTTNTVDILRRDGGGQFQQAWSFGSTYFGGKTPGSPFGDAPIGKATSFGSFGTDLLDSAAITVGLSDGTLAFGRLTMTTTPTLVTTNLGPADGETSVGIDRRPDFQLNWHAEYQDEFELHGHFGNFNEHPSTGEAVYFGTIDLGTMNPDFQGLAGASGPDGNRYVLADKCYWYTPDGPSPEVHLIPDYPYWILGGPVDLVFPEGMKVGFAPGPGSQMLGILGIVEIFSEGFEEGDTDMWSSSAP